MDSLREIFSNHESPLKDLPEGHEIRFEKKLKQVNAVMLKPVKLTGYAAAAIVLLFLFITFVVSNKIDPTQKKPDSFALNQEILDTEVYFENQVHERLEMINTFDVDNSQKQLIYSDLKEFDDSLSELKADLKDLQNEERVFDALVYTYMLKIEALDNIVIILQKSS